MTESAVTGPGTLISAGLICFCAGGLYGWSALIPVIENKFNGSTEQSGLVFSIAIVAFSIAVIVSPRLSSKFSGLYGCVLFGCCGAGCLLLAVMAPSYLLFLITFGVGFGVCSGAIYINALATAAQSSRPAVITPLMVASFGMGGAVSGLVWRLLVLREWGAMALVPLIIALVVACIAGGMVNKRAAPVIKANTTVSSNSPALRRRGVFLLLWLSFALGSAGGLMVLGLAGKMTDSVGAGTSLTSIAVAGVALGNTLGRLSVGGFNYAFKPVNTALLAVSVAATGLITTYMAVSPSLVVVGLIIVASGYGAVASTIPALVGAIYGKDNFARVFSYVFSAWGVAGLIAPWLAGAIHDRTGGFQMAILLALLATIGSVITLLSLKLITLADHR